MPEGAVQFVVPTRVKAIMQSLPERVTVTPVALLTVWVQVPLLAATVAAEALATKGPTGDRAGVSARMAMVRRASRRRQRDRILRH